MSKLLSHGYAVTGPLDERGSTSLARELGEIADDVLVKLVPGKRTYLARHEPIPVHTDHPLADFIAWRCEAQDARDGAALLVDGFETIGRLDAATKEALGRVLLPAAVRSGDVAHPTAVLASANGRDHVFYAPWLEPTMRAPALLEALVAWRAALSRCPMRLVRLAPGEVLVVDNHRMLHGRGALLENSTRRLRRFWIRAQPATATSARSRVRPPLK